MKKILLILSILFCFNLASATSINRIKTNIDTSHVQTVNISPVTSVMHGLYTALTFNKFDGMIIFLDSRVNFGLTQLDSTILSENMTDVKIIETLNSIYKDLHYTRFKIASARNSINGTLIIVQVFVLQNGQEIYLECTFLLNSKGQITSILFY